MPEQELRCPCGGGIEELGDVRYYGTGRAILKLDGEREWVAETWSTPVETLELDDPPYRCLGCDRELKLEDMVVLGMMACGCPLDTHGSGISDIQPHHRGRNPWALRTAILKQELDVARAKLPAEA